MGNFAENLNLGNRVRPPPDIWMVNPGIPNDNILRSTACTQFREDAGSARVCASRCV